MIVGKYRSGDIRDCYANAEKLYSFGYRPKMDLKTGLADLVAWAEEQEANDDVERAHNELVSRGLVA